VRLDSPAVLATAGALAIHLLLAVAGDALVVSFPPRKHVPPPRVELFDIEVPEVVKPLPPPVEAAKEPEPEPEATKPAPEPEPRPVKRAARTTHAPPPTTTEPPPPATTPASDDSGGAPVTQMENIAPSATGVAVRKGKPSTGHIGRGGTGRGTGTGAGAGSADEAPRPMSIATIKKRAMPKGDFSYFDASKDYPPEARSLGIEGVIRVRLVVDETGAVKSAVLLNKLGHGLDELAMTRARQIKFDPALDTDDKPVTSVVVWTFNMTLPK
jgi:protein TonB